MLNPSQLVWRCRRGVRELDVLFGRYLEVEYEKLDNAEKKIFERFLDVQDPIIMDWIFAKAVPQDSSFEPIIQQIRILASLDS